VILNNSPIYISKKFQAKIQHWREQDVYILFIPPYSPKLNLIEILWRWIKYQWLSFQAYLFLQSLKERFLNVLQNVGVKYDIIF
jgi:transposase